MDDKGELTRKTTAYTSWWGRQWPRVRPRSYGQSSPGKWSPSGCPRHLSNVGRGEFTRWNDHLNPLISKKDWTSADTLKLIELQRLHSSKWSVIASEFSQRSATFLKNTFFLGLRKVLRKLAKFCTRPISSADLKTLQPKILTEFLWSEFDLSALNRDLNVPLLPMTDLFKMVILGDMKVFQATFNKYTRPLVDAVFGRLYQKKWVN